MFGNKNPQNDNTVMIIAEAGVNHNGEISIAKQLIDIAVEAGADAVKFQTFKADKVVSTSSPKAAYQLLSNDRETQYEMIKRLELDRIAHEDLQTHCVQCGIHFMSTPFDHESIELLNDLGLEIIKIPSGEITNLPHLRHIGRLRKKVILSTGMADLGEIEDAIDILLEQGTLRKSITLLHCNTEYPTPIEDVNLNALNTIRTAFPGIKIGYSDHTLGIEIPIAAVVMGAVTIEKHFTLNRNMEGPDHRASLEPDELKAMVTAIRKVEKALGSGIKKPTPSESKNIAVARKSILAACSIKKGEILDENNLYVKRPGTGISPMRWDEIVGQAATKHYKKDEFI